MMLGQHFDLLIIDHCRAMLSLVDRFVVGCNNMHHTLYNGATEGK